MISFWKSAKLKKQKIQQQQLKPEKAHNLKPIKSLMGKPTPIRMLNKNIYPLRSQAEWRAIIKDPFGDTDKDKLMNWFDCRPLNKKKQDVMPIITKASVTGRGGNLKKGHRARAAIIHNPAAKYEHAKEELKKLKDRDISDLDSYQKFKHNKRIAAQKSVLTLFERDVPERYLSGKTRADAVILLSEQAAISQPKRMKKSIVHEYIHGVTKNALPEGNNLGYNKDVQEVTNWLEKKEAAFQLKHHPINEEKKYNTIVQNPKATIYKVTKGYPKREHLKELVAEVFSKHPELVYEDYKKDPKSIPPILRKIIEDKSTLYGGKEVKRFHTGFKILKTATDDKLYTKNELRPGFYIQEQPQIDKAEKLGILPVSYEVESRLPKEQYGVFALVNEGIPLHSAKKIHSALEMGDVARAEYLRRESLQKLGLMKIDISEKKHRTFTPKPLPLAQEAEVMKLINEGMSLTEAKKRVFAEQRRQATPKGMTQIEIFENLEKAQTDDEGSYYLLQEAEKDIKAERIKQAKEKKEEMKEKQKEKKELKKYRKEAFVKDSDDVPLDIKVTVPKGHEEEYARAVKSVEEAMDKS